MINQPTQMKYTCDICKSTQEQRSHHTSHLKTKKHKDQRRIMELELKVLSEVELLQQYNTTDINKILDEKQNIITGKKTKILKKKNEFFPKKKEGNITWENTEPENEYQSMKNKLNNVVKSAHQILYNNGSIVGNKAVTDIQKLLALKLLEREFNNPDSIAGKSLVNLESKTKSISNFSKFINVCKNLSILKDQDNPLKFWENMVSRVLMKTYPYVFGDEDKKFHITSETGFQELVNCVGSLQITDDFLDAFATTCGDVHESFLAYSGGKAARDLGQFFTPRKLINLIFKGTFLEQYIIEIEEPSIYDPCMGTAGFLTRTFKHCKIKSENVYGCETEQDTIKFAFTSCLMTMGDTQANLIKCNSLSQNKLVFEKKMSSIVTNPPFGTKMNYGKLEKEFNDFKDKNLIESEITFKDIYPLKTNNGAALFVMHCVFMLEENGVCAVVLPDGELFEGSSKWSMNFREWLCENVNIRTIIKAASGTFDHAGVKTNIVIFTKTGATKQIEFFETDKDCQKLTKIFNVSESDLAHKKYSLDVGEYLEEKSENYDVPVVPLGEVCKFEGYKYIKRSDMVEGQYKVIGGGKKPSGYHNQYNKEPNTILCAGSGSSGYISRYDEYTWASECFSIHSSDSEILNENYLYLYLKFNQDRIYLLIPANSCRSHMYPKNLSKLKIPLPSLEIQQQIVDELSKIETSIQTIDTRISELKNEKEMYNKHAKKCEIKEILKGTEEKNLGEVCDIVNGSQLDRKNIKEGQYPVFGGGKKNVGNHNEYNREGGEIIVCGTGAYCGFVQRYLTPYWASQCFTIKSKTDNLLSDYLYYLSKYSLETKFMNSKKGGGQPYIRGSQFVNLKIPVPCPAIQQQCIQIFKEKEKLILSIDEKIIQEQKYIDNLRQLAKDVISSFC